MNFEQYLSNPNAIIGIVSFILLGILYTYLKSLKKKLSTKWVIISLILVILTNGICGLWGLNLFLENYSLMQISVVGVNLLLGALIVFWGVKGRFNELNWKQFTTPIILFLCEIFGFITLAVIFNLLNKSNFGYILATQSLYIFLPYFIFITYSAFVSIPGKIYKVWYLDSSKEEPDFDRINVNRIHLLSIEFIKHVNDSESTDMRVKAPHEMKFGDWFQSFILNYNEKFSESPIQYQYLDKTSMGWIFYENRGFFSGKRYIDPDLTIIKNGLSEKHPIVAERVKIFYH